MNATTRENGGLRQRDLDALARAEHADPFAVLGPHGDGAGGQVVRAFLPTALNVRILARHDGRVLAEMEQGSLPGLFTAHLDEAHPYLLQIGWAGGEQITEDPYSFGPQLGDMDLYLFAEGNHRDLSGRFGAQPIQVDGVDGVCFSVWAPNARRVSVVGDFNNWDGRRHPMRLRHSAGVWELFVPRLGVGETYKFEVLGKDGILPLKADPLARATELPPSTASKVAGALSHDWQDHDWMAQRAQRHAYSAPLSIYELHPGSWRCELDEAGEVGRYYNWRELAERLVPYVQELGFTHIELLPIMEHPFGGSWGYQPLSLFAPTSRYGSAEDFAAFIDACHQGGIGVLLDWVPAHFPTDEHGLARFDGTALYEYDNPWRATTRTGTR